MLDVQSSIVAKLQKLPNPLMETSENFYHTFLSATQLSTCLLADLYSILVFIYDYSTSLLIIKAAEI